MRISTVCCARTPNLEIAFFSGDFLTTGGAFPWRRQDRNGATLDFALAQSPESKVCGDEGAEGLGICSTSARKIIIKP